MADRMARRAGPLVAEFAKDVVLDLAERRAIILGVADRWWAWGTLASAVVLAVSYQALGWTARLRGAWTEARPR
jgi:hypothetical protein